MIPNGARGGGGVNPTLCPVCGQLAVKDFNVFPQSMWQSDTQTWHCETCSARLTRTFTPGNGWSAWSAN